MKANREFARAYVSPKAERACRADHPWVYDTEVERFEPPEADARTAFEGVRPAEALGVRPAAMPHPTVPSAGQAGAQASVDATDSRRADAQATRQKGGSNPFASPEGPEGPRSREVANGELVDVLSRKGAYLGTGILSLSSKIRIRLISTNSNDLFDEAFWERKVRWAWQHRKTVMGDDVGCCRIIFSEADGFCGLVVDRFENVLVTQTLAFGMERLKPVIFPLLMKVLAEDGVRIRGIYERNDVSTRKLEGLAQTCGWYPLPNTPPNATAGAADGGVAANAGGGGEAGTLADALHRNVSRETFAPRGGIDGDPTPVYSSGIVPANVDGADTNSAAGECGAAMAASERADTPADALHWNVSRETFSTADAAGAAGGDSILPGVGAGGGRAGNPAPTGGDAAGGDSIPTGGPAPTSPAPSGGPGPAGGLRAALPQLADVPAPIAPDDPQAAAFGPTSVRIVENGVRYLVDFEHGQKTGFFLDQKYNRRAVGALAGGRRVLDCFTHTGSFALNAALGGAAHVHAVDISALAIDAAQANAQLNGPDVAARISFEVANVFDLLPQLEAAHGRDGRGGRYDFIILDPPAFTKSRRTVDSASRGYHEINQRAMRILPRGGYLATCSCSHFMDAARFRSMLAAAAQGANVQLRQIAERQQAPDHPILWGVPETDYLKFFLFQVV